MPGAGTRTAITTNNPPDGITARCLDLTRLISRVGRGPLTGVDRVELAYLTRLLEDPLPLYLLVRTALGYVLLDKAGAGQIAARINREVVWGAPDLIGRLSRKASPAKRRAEADLRRFAIARCRRGRLASMLGRVLPPGCAYLNVGHSNLGTEVLQAWRGLPKPKISILVHDMIPLDYPQYQRAGTSATFEAKMRRVAGAADLIICNSRQTRADVTRWFATWDAQANTVVAHLGVDLPVADAAFMPPDIDLSGPYFLMLGTIEPRKNHALLLDIWESFARDLPSADIPQLIIAGSRGWENHDVFARLDALPRNDSPVQERAGLTDAQVAGLMDQAAGVLFPSFAEGYGLPAAEAISLGAPVICSKLPVFEEFLGNIPVYAESADVYLWKQSILQLAEQKRAGQTGGTAKSLDFDTPTWAEHFNLVLKMT